MATYDQAYGYVRVQVIGSDHINWIALVEAVSDEDEPSIVTGALAVSFFSDNHNVVPVTAETWAWYEVHRVSLVAAIAQALPDLPDCYVQVMWEDRYGSTLNVWTIQAREEDE